MIDANRDMYGNYIGRAPRRPRTRVRDTRPVRTRP